MEITGRIIERGEIEVISDRFSKREVVVETDGNDEGKYQQQIPIEFINKSIDRVEGFPVGSRVTVSIEIRGRRWDKKDGTHKYFVSISGWRIQKADTGGATYPIPETGGGGGGRTPGDDDIPFEYFR